LRPGFNLPSRDGRLGDILSFCGGECAGYFPFDNVGVDTVGEPTLEFEYDEAAEEL
jgi:hypothetical protein